MLFVGCWSGGVLKVVLVIMDELIKRLRDVEEGVVMSKSDWCKLGVECGYLRKGGVGRSRVVKGGGGGGGVKRARSAYMLFTKSKLSDEEERMKSEGMKFMKIRGDTWKKMDEEARRPYVEASEKEKMELKKGMGIEEDEEVVKKEVKKKKRGRPKKEKEDKELSPRDRAELISSASLGDDEIVLSFSDEEDLFGSDVEVDVEEDGKMITGSYEHKGVKYELSEDDELIDTETKRSVGCIVDGVVEMYE